MGWPPPTSGTTLPGLPTGAILGQPANGRSPSLRYRSAPLLPSPSSRSPALPCPVRCGSAGACRGRSSGPTSPSRCRARCCCRPVARRHTKSASSRAGATVHPPSRADARRLPADDGAPNRAAHGHGARRDSRRHPPLPLRASLRGLAGAHPTGALQRPGAAPQLDHHTGQHLPADAAVPRRAGGPASRHGQLAIR